MRNPKELRKFWQRLSDKDLNNLIKEVKITKAARIGDHQLSHSQSDLMMKIFEEIFDMTEKDIEEIKEKIKDYIKEIEILAEGKRKRPFCFNTVPTKERKWVLAKILAGVGTIGTAGYAAILNNRKKRRTKEEKNSG